MKMPFLARNPWLGCREDKDIYIFNYIFLHKKKIKATFIQSKVNLDDPHFCLKIGQIMIDTKITKEKSAVLCLFESTAVAWNCERSGYFNTCRVTVPVHDTK